MKVSRDNQMAFADTVLRLLARGICAVSMFDKRVAADIEALGGGFSFAVCAGLGENSPAIKLRTENGRFVRVSADINASDVIIRFKDISGLIPVLTGKISVGSAFAQHRMLVCGNINQAVALVRIIDITEAYLFPKFVIKKAMRRVPRKQAPRLFIYIMLLFFGVRKPTQPSLPAIDAEPGIAEEKISDTSDETNTKLEAVK